ncbi:chaperone protein ClpB [candidate division WOR-1 bacterium RIFOXYA12_FULL_43_27]|uniref:Chaperone protein ClpB n=1 Tax=candidate division WOR-1 bacterium RIFOXYC2_FULL_46_14 TaxID=1802587 RepID=A0A1F4U8L7_UNCSA|nr:MAG: chaperone protein ClpB [candidate division WOR-1 bacterium RIFOXYA12_FULL_43_27]OGC19577.1 MAG: chaperone protein ClpB [candidate division WOR-1 bacterium RIFOXYB2_FULL_46_45]OGC30566.1 MAG: chaperone protein ClpB [candidate division WOR-1 bacterium RIFOXYA2_FULL_46_56]OGC40633.1 MAG: chaperone protein ClpB [candidate division WOR-1 bacterium RIFOXYC2_FULL_46_14]
MFERFSEPAIRVIMAAQEEAIRSGCNFVGAEHLFLGILREKDPRVIGVLESFKVAIPDIKETIEQQISFGHRQGQSNELPFNQQIKRVIELAWEEARGLGHSYIGVEHLFLGMMREGTGITGAVISQFGIDFHLFKSRIVAVMAEQAMKMAKPQQKSATPVLDNFSRDLTLLAASKKMDPVIGRGREIERVIQILSRRKKNNPVLIGEAGVGKTAIVEGIAQRIIAQNVPQPLVGKRVVTLDLGLLIAGTRYRGEFEERLKKIMDEVKKAQNVVLFIDELHTLIGAGAAEGAMDAANILKPVLARGEFQCIGATTMDEYRKRIESDPALERRFQQVMVEEPNVADTMEILKGLKGRYEDFHKVKITDDALVSAARLSDRYISERRLPDKAIDLLDEASSRVMLKNSGKKEVNAETIAEVVAGVTGIPVTQLTSEETERLLKMEETLKKRLVGQDEAIAAIAKSIRRSRAGLKDPRRPIGSFLFLGPSGVGKTELAKRLAEFLFGDMDAIVRVDMSEYLEQHTVSRLMGSPPGYVGHGEGGQLTEPVRRRPHSVVLFDEVEKAHRDVLNTLLQIMEDGHLTDSEGRKVDFRNTVIIMTSNAGAELIQKESTMGFVGTESASSTYDKMKKTVLDEIKKQFRPEFLNRIDETIVFKALSKEDLSAIVNIMLADLNKRLEEKGLSLKLKKKPRDFLVEKAYDPKFGARPLRRALEDFVEDPLSEKVLLGKLPFGSEIDASVSGDLLMFDARAAESEE